MNIGFDQPPSVLPFDHRGSFETRPLVEFAHVTEVSLAGSTGIARLGHRAIRSREGCDAT